MLTVIDIEWQILMSLKLSGFKVMSCFGDHTKMGEYTTRLQLKTNQNTLRNITNQLAPTPSSPMTCYIAY